MDKEKSWCATSSWKAYNYRLGIVYLNTSCGKHTITVCESCTKTQDIKFLTLLGTCFVSKRQLGDVFEERYFWKKSIYPFVWKKLRFFLNVFFLVFNTHFTSIFPLTTHCFNPRLQTKYWNVSIFNVSKRVELQHICFSKMET